MLNKLHGDKIVRNSIHSPVKNINNMPIQQFLIGHRFFSIKLRLSYKNIYFKIQHIGPMHIRIYVHVL